MRKILLMVAIILLLVFGYVTVVNGIKIGNLQIASIKQIDEKSKQLDNDTEELNSLIDVTYPAKMVELTDTSKKMQVAKTKYLDETNLSTEEEIQNALQIQSYDIERLWTKIGNHAKNEGVNLKLVLNSSSSGATDTRDLAFTVDGSYIGITNFIYAIEDDEELDFRIYNFKIVPYQNDILQSTFVVKDIRITSSSLNDALTSSINTNADQNNTENTQANNTTTNAAKE